VFIVNKQLADLFLLKRFFQLFHRRKQPHVRTHLQQATKLRCHGKTVSQSIINLYSAEAQNVSHALECRVTEETEKF